MNSASDIGDDVSMEDQSDYENTGMGPNLQDQGEQQLAKNQINRNKPKLR